MYGRGLFAHPMDLDELMGVLQKRFKPYGGDTPSFTALPSKGIARKEVITLLTRLQRTEGKRWQRGRVSGAVYHGAPEHVRFATQAYALGSQSNPLHPDVWPSLLKMESEMVAMTGRMLGGSDTTRGAVTSGGTESILLAMKAYRDRARSQRGTQVPEAILPTTAHVAFDKACDYFGLRAVRVPVTSDLTADVEAVKAAINERTAVVVGSAPCFPYGVVDPIRELAGTAKDRGVGFHSDACLGGFLLPWAKRLGHRVPDFDLTVPGVTSLSVDTHKYGYAPKGTSVILYTDPELLRHQYYVAKGWPGGIYFSPTLAGSRPGGLVTAAWATMLALGEEGYLSLAERVLGAAQELRRGIPQVPGLSMMGDSLFVEAFTSSTQDIYQVMEALSSRGWFLNGLQRPPGVHLAVTLRHAARGVTHQFLSDLRWAVDHASDASSAEGLAPIYGLAGTMPEDAVEEFIGSVLDWMYHAS